MKKSILFSAFFGVGGTLLLFGLGGLQDLSRYESLKDPQLRQLPAQKMLVVEAKGDPNIVGQNVFGLLFKTFFSLPGVKMAAPRARWLNFVNTPKNEWRGLYGLPLPESISSLPQDVTGVRIETWEYGDVVEILHIGPYSEEIPTVQKLLKFVEEKGYRISGAHEEEYLKGPGIASSPAEYWTIIRYQVNKR